MLPKLKGKVAIITGAGQGIGKAFALRFAEEGALLLLPDVNCQKAEAVAAEIRSKGGSAIAISTDISDQTATNKMAEKALEAYGRIDILLNNAGIWDGINITPWDNWKVADWERIFKVNVIGMWLCCKAVVPAMMKQKGGKIINMASGVSKTGAAQFYLPYACSKGADYTLTQALARTLGPSGINVNAIAPGYTASEASLKQIGSDKTFEFAVMAQAIQRREQPVDLVGTAVFLASSDSDFITGQVIFVDGGVVMS
jgi:NAD(P)-dependent dehydrogenase (short-subunit alcohol dehydrogenase family)